MPKNKMKTKLKKILKYKDQKDYFCWLKIISTTKKVTTTYRFVNLIRFVRVTGNFPVRLLALRMLWS